jgi:hypothetical protein
MSIAIAEQQNELKEEQTSRPNAGRAAEPRQDPLGNDWLDKKQVHRGNEDRRRVYENMNHVAVRRCHS